MRKFLCLLVLMLMVFLCGTAIAGNSNDLAYLSIAELDEASSPSVTDEVILVQSGIPKQGTTVSELSQVKVSAVDIHNTTDMTEVLATETGKTFIAKQNTKFQLPAAADGLTYTFVAGAAVEIEIQVATTPSTIVFMIADGKSNGVIETAGTNTTGNSVTLTSDGTNWYAVSYSGTWETGGEWTQLNLGAQ